jgi:lysozyme
MLALLSQHEGRVAHAYQDSLGYWTIGVGHLIDKRKGGKLPDEIIDMLLDYDMRAHWLELLKALPWIERLDDVRQGVLLDMAFNLGVDGLLAFKSTLRLVERGEYKLASKAMLVSLWARQVKSRAKRLSTMMETGQWSAE